MLHECPICKKEKIVSRSLIACVECIKENRENIILEIAKVHRQSRHKFALRETVTKKHGLNCNICANNCSIQEGEFGFCGLRMNRSNKLIHIAGTKEKGLLDWYYDHLPTNCVAEWVCEGTKHSGLKNLAVFYRSCSFNCLFCQNWHFKETNLQIVTQRVPTRLILSAKELANCVDDRTFCICYFGGDPATQLPHALATSYIVRREKQNVRICWETNGSMNPNLLKLMIKISLESGGCIKFDLKAYNENLHYSFCGVSNKRTLENFAYVGRYVSQRNVPPLLIASTLLVPGYINSDEVHKIATFIASIDKSIPYSLLAFYPQFYLTDLPTTSKKQAEECFMAAKEAGLERVHIGNILLLS